MENERDEGKRQEAGNGKREKRGKAERQRDRERLRERESERETRRDENVPSIRTPSDVDSVEVTLPPRGGEKGEGEGSQVAMDEPPHSSTFLWGCRFREVGLTDMR